MFSMTWKGQFLIWFAKLTQTCIKLNGVILLVFFYVLLSEQKSQNLMLWSSNVSISELKTCIFKSPCAQMKQRLIWRREYKNLSLHTLVCVTLSILHYQVSLPAVSPPSSSGSADLLGLGTPTSTVPPGGSGDSGMSGLLVDVFGSVTSNGTESTGGLTPGAEDGYQK